MATPSRTPRHCRSRSIETLSSENSNPNIASSSPLPSLKSTKSPSSKSVPAKKSVSRTPSRALEFPVLAPAPPVPRPGRKFIVTKKNPKRKDGDLDFNKCRAEAYEALRASQEEFFRKEKSQIMNPVIKVEAFKEKSNGSGEQLETAAQTKTVSLKKSVSKDQNSRSAKKSEASKPQRIASSHKSSSGPIRCHDTVEKSDVATVELKKDEISEDCKKDCAEKSEIVDEPKIDLCEELEIANLEGSSKVRKMRSIAMKKAIGTMPDPGSGRVKHLVHAFESLQLIKKDEESEKKGEEEEEEKEEEKDERKQRVINWALPGLQPITKPTDNRSGPVPLSSSAEFISFAGFERDDTSKLHSSLDSNTNRSSWESRTTGGARRSSKRSSSDSLKSWNKKLKATSLHPFKLRTDQRGRKKEEQFLKKVEEMLLEEKKMRIPVAQGLPWTTEEPECLVRPPVKERTEPVDLLLHTDVRAVERAEFDNFVCERLKYAEELRLQRERQRQMEEEEEIKRLRKELVPKAQPMPYFDRPFVPKRSSKPRTVAKEPTFHLRPAKLSCYYRLQCIHEHGKQHN